MSGNVPHTPLRNACNVTNTPLMFTSSLENAPTKQADGKISTSVASLGGAGFRHEKYSAFGVHQSWMIGKGERHSNLDVFKILVVCVYHKWVLGSVQPMTHSSKASFTTKELFVAYVAVLFSQG